MLCFGAFGATVVSVTGFFPSTVRQYAPAAANPSYRDDRDSDRGPQTSPSQLDTSFASHLKTRVDSPLIYRTVDQTVRHSHARKRRTHKPADMNAANPMRVGREDHPCFLTGSGTRSAGGLFLGCTIRTETAAGCAVPLRR